MVPPQNEDRAATDWLMKLLIRDIMRSAHIKWLRLCSRRTRMFLPLWAGVDCCSASRRRGDRVRGVIARLVAEGDAPHIVVMTGGEGSHRGCCNLSDKDIKEARRGGLRRVRDFLHAGGEYL